MAWFKKEVKKEESKRGIPSLPELPELPELPRFGSGKEEIHKLPSFPSNSFGEKFSQNAIKEAVSGEEGDNEVWEADEFAREQEMQTMRQPHKKLTKPYEAKEIPSEFRQATREIKKADPLFIRLDKFEESSKTFDKIKTKVSEIDKLLKDLKKVNEEEGAELDSWEENLQTIKKQIEKIDQDLFSRV